MFNTLLIANRGEIACRIIKTARRLGIKTIAVYSTADEQSLHVKQADEAYWIGESPVSESYLNIETIINVALATKAEAIHPGYGLLSENPQFATACEQANIIFVGPSVAAMNAMASKQWAKQLLEKTAVPLTPGYHGNDQTDARLLNEARQLGFPVLLKAASGGGGKGMRSVYEENEFQAALEGARRESKASFGDDTLLIEKLLIQPRHVEMQILADNHGQILHLFERDCSIQRRHQKIIEEAPAPHLSISLRERLAKAAVEVARTIQYQGAGTIEFLVDTNENFYFMEMNTRLQVEHPVTEMITGVDLVEWQLRIAANEKLPWTQSEIIAKGHAIECRIYAEDPQRDFMPSIGQLHFLKAPTGDCIRIDTGVEQGSHITLFYDPMIAKLIAWGESREQALSRLQQALPHYLIGGVKTNILFLQSILQHPAFQQGRLSTDFLSRETIPLPQPDYVSAAIMAACLDYLASIPATSESLKADTFSWEMFGKMHWVSHYMIHGEHMAVTVTPHTPGCITGACKGINIKLRCQEKDNVLHLDDGVKQSSTGFSRKGTTLFIYSNQGVIVVSPYTWQTAEENAHTDGQLTAPMPGTIVAILKNKGDKVKAGERLIVLEAMKMEHTIRAPQDGFLSDIYYTVGSQVNEGEELVALTPEIGTSSAIE